MVGSSSSGGTTFVPPPAATGELPITANNAVDITADVIEAISSLFDLLQVTDVTNLPLSDLPFSQADLGVTSDLPFAAIAGPVFGEQQRSVIVDASSCDAGSYTNTWDDADDDREVSTGDTLDIAFADCVFADMGVTLGGSTFVTGIDITGDIMSGIPPWSLGANFAFVDLVGIDSESTVTVNGNFDIAAATADGLMLDLEISGARLSAMEGGLTDTLSNFRVTEQFDLVAQMIAIDAAGTLTSDRLNGTISFSTPTRLIVIGDDNPSSGQITITHSSSGIVATVLDNISVQLAIDTDGDGTAETTIVVTWLDLDISA